MIDLTTKALPETVEVDGRAFQLNTDFRVWIRFERDLKKAYESGEPFEVTYCFKDEKPTYLDVSLLMAWAHPPKELPRAIAGDHNDAIMLDLDIDADMIYSAFWEQYGIDLLTVDLHWYQFMALLSCISDKTQLGHVIGYRGYKKSDKNTKRDIREDLRKAWEIKPPMSADEQAEVDEFNSYFE